MTALARDKSPRFASVEAFLAHEFGDDLPRELLDGIAVAHAAPSSQHARIVANLSRALGNALEASGSPCFVEAGSGVRPQRRRRATLRVPDVMIRCPGDGATPDDLQAVVVFEILSPSNSAADMDDKARDYKSISSIRQIVHVRQDRLLCSFQRRAGELWIAEEVEGTDAVLALETGTPIPLAAIYRNVPVDAEGDARSAG